MQEWLRIFLFYLLSAMEGAVIFLLMIKMFRFSIRAWWKEIVFAVLLTSYVNYLLWHNEMLTSYLLLFQFSMLYLFNWIVLRCNWLHSVIMMCIAFAAYTLIQMIVLFTYAYMGVTSSKLDGTQPISTYIYQSTSSLMGWGLIYLLSKWKIGFIFVSSKVRTSSESYKLWTNLLIFVICIIIPSGVYSIYRMAGELKYVWFFLAAQLLSLIILIIFAYRQEKQKHLNQSQAYFKREKELI